MKIRNYFCLLKDHGWKINEGDDLLIPDEKKLVLSWFVAKVEKLSHAKDKKVWGRLLKSLANVKLVVNCCK